MVLICISPLTKEQLFMCMIAICISYVAKWLFTFLPTYKYLYINVYIFIYKCIYIHTYTGFPGGSEVKSSTCNAGDLGSIPGSGRSPGEGNGNPLQYSCLENPMDRGAWWATVHGVAKSQTRLSDFPFTFTFTHIYSGIFIVTYICEYFLHFVSYLFIF